MGASSKILRETACFSMGAATVQVLITSLCLCTRLFFADDHVYESPGYSCNQGAKRGK